MTKSKLVDNGLVVGGCLVVHTPSSVYNLQSALVNEFFYRVSHVFVLGLPPVVEVGCFDLNEPGTNTREILTCILVGMKKFLKGWHI